MCYIQKCRYKDLRLLAESLEVLIKTMRKYLIRINVN